MDSDFLRPDGAEKQVRIEEEIYSDGVALSAAECLEPHAVEQFLKRVSSEIRYKADENEFKENRLNRGEREKAGLDLSKRQYNTTHRRAHRAGRWPGAPGAARRCPGPAPGSPPQGTGKSCC